MNGTFIQELLIPQGIHVVLHLRNQTYTWFSTAREQEKSCICLLVHFAFQLISLFLSKRIYQKYCMKNKKIVHHFLSFCVHGLLQILHSNLNESAFTTNSPVTPIKNKESLLINSCIRIKWIVIDTFTTILMLQVIEKKWKLKMLYM